MLFHFCILFELCSLHGETRDNNEHGSFHGQKMLKCFHCALEVLDSVFSVLQGFLFCFVLSMCRVVKFIVL